jgi:glutamate synthase (NADPH/NADH) small chain
LEYARAENPYREELVRLRDFEELHTAQPAKVRQCQAARCMDCGVPFCQSDFGCPLHNLIPEWNDLLYRGQEREALNRLLMTAPFPELTGRVCPALCEKACNLADDGVTNRDNELYLIETGFEKGWIRPRIPLARTRKRVAVVGSGPSGLAAADWLNQAGHAVTVIERADRPGGLLMYGIPNMKLPKDVVERRAELMRSCGIELRCGCDASDSVVAARLLDESDAVVVAVGARQARRLSVPGADAEGVVLAVDYLTSATNALLDGGEPAVSAAGLDVVVIGGGDTGTDCVATALRQGACSVRQLEFLPEPPRKRRNNNLWPEWPAIRKDDYGQLEAAAVFGNDPREWGVDTLEVLVADGAATGLRVASLDWSSGQPERIKSSERTLPAQLILIAMGFVGPEAAIFEALGIELPTRGAAHWAGGRVWLAGDCRSGSSLVVNSIADGLACAAEVAAALGC